MMFFQVGGFYEFYDTQAEIAINELGLNRMKATRRFRVRCGFPVSLKAKYLRKLIGLGLPVYIANEEDGGLCGVRKRRVSEGWIPGC